MENQEGSLFITMQKISGILNFKRNVLASDQLLYLKAGKNYLSRAYQPQNQSFIETRCPFSTAQKISNNKIPPSEKNTEINKNIAQAYLEHGNRLRDMGLIKEARASYEAAHAFDQPAADEKLQALSDIKTPSLPHKFVSQNLISASTHLEARLFLQSISLSATCFKHNLPPVVVDADIATAPRDIKNTRHLARCLQSAQASKNQELNELARNILEAFAKRDFKDLDIWREVVPLAATADPGKCRYLIGKAHDALTTQEKLLDVSALQSLAMMIHSLPEPFFKNSAGDLVKLLQTLTRRLSSEHIEGNLQQFQLLLQTTSQILDVMAKASVTDINRIQVQEPLDKILSKLSQTPELRFQAYYARQALAHIPNDESRWQETWRRSSSVILGATNLANVVQTFDPKKLLNAFYHFSEAFSGASETVKRLTELANEMNDFGSTMLETGTAIWDSLTKNKQQRWYAALQFLDICLEEGQLVQFEQFARHSPYSRNEAFLLGLCQRLEQIAYIHKEETTQAAALQFLGDLVQNKSRQWGQYDRVQQAVHRSLGRLEKTKALSEPMQAQVRLLLEQWPPMVQKTKTASDIDQYIVPVWDPAWQQVGTQLLQRARGDERLLTQSQSVVLQSNKAPLAFLGLEKDISTLEAQYAKELEDVDEVRDALAMYVAPQGKLTVDSSEQFDLESKVRAFLASDKKVFLLLGEAGSGKSTFNRYLAHRLWDDYNKAKPSQERPIPLFIPLSTLDNSSKNLIEQYLEGQGLSTAQVEALRKARRFIFILDGYDELAQRSRAFDNRFDRWQAHVIISSRPEYLGSGYQSKFQPQGKPRLFEECRLASFSDASIEHYIYQYVKYVKPKWGAREYQQAFKSNSELKDLVRNPFMLNMALEVLSTMDSEQSWAPRLTRVALYNTFVENWCARSQERLGRIQLRPTEQEAFERLDEEGFVAHEIEFSQRFAVALHLARAVTVTYSAASDAKLGDWREEFLGNAEKTRLLRFNAPLIRQNNQYRFIHKSLQDYFVARTLWEEMRAFVEIGHADLSKQFSVTKNLRQLWSGLEDFSELKSSALLNQLNIVEDPAVLSFLVEQVRQEPTLIKPLLAWIKASKTRDGMDSAAANALTILVKAGTQLNGLDLSQIKVPGADLSYGLFDQTQFAGADLTEVRFRGAWLRGANLENAQLRGVNFGELPSLEVGSKVSDCCYSPDGHWLAVSTSESGIKLYRTEVLELVHTFGEEEEAVNSVSFSPNSAFLASGGEDTQVKLWQVESGEMLHMLTGHSDAVNSVSFSPDGKFLVSGSRDETLKLWRAESGEELLTFKGHSDRVRSVSFSPNGEIIASGSKDGTVKLWSTAGGEALQTLECYGSAVNSVHFSPNGEFLAAGNYRVAKLWEVKSGKELHTLAGHNGWVSSLTFSPDGKFLASGSSDNMIKLWNIDSGEEVYTLEGHSRRVKGLNFSPNNKFLVSGSGDGTVKLWSVEDGEESQMLGGHSHGVRSVKFSPNGECLASGSADNTIKLWSVKSGEELHTLKGHKLSVLKVNFSLDGKFLASGSWDKTVKLWNVDRAEELHTFEGHSERISSVSFSLDGKLLASGSWDNTVRLWSVDNKQELHLLKAHDSWVSSVNFSPDGKLLASASQDGTVKLWNVENGEELRALDGHRYGVSSIIFSPDGKFLASGGADRLVKLWNVESGEMLHMLAGHSSWVMSVNFSPDNKYLVSSAKDEAVKLWSVETGKCTATLPCFFDWVDSIAWPKSAENNIKLAGGKGRAAHIWQIEPTANDWKIGLYWASSQNKLTLTNASIQGAQGLSPMNARLFAQRQISR